MKDHYRDFSLFHHHSLTPNRSGRAGIGIPQQRQKEAPVLPPKRGAWMANKKNFMRGTDLSV
jgi:hypothetical protein